MRCRCWPPEGVWVGAGPSKMGCICPLALGTLEARMLEVAWESLGGLRTVITAGYWLTRCREPAKSQSEALATRLPGFASGFIWSVSCELRNEGNRFLELGDKLRRKLLERSMTMVLSFEQFIMSLYEQPWRGGGPRRVGESKEESLVARPFCRPGGSFFSTNQTERCLVTPISQWYCLTT